MDRTSSLARRGGEETRCSPNDRRPSAEEAVQLLETMPVGFIYWDRQWRCIGVNAQGERLSGKTASELFGHSLWQLFPDVVGTEFETVYRRVAATGRPENVETFYPEPINRWLDIYVTVAEQGVAAYYVDVTRRHRAQEGRDLVAAHDRSVAQTLQQVLLPRLSDIGGVNIVARYLTAENSAEVGGDWYDAIAGAGGRLSVMIGDVAGHDINAAATMGQLRSMLRMSAWDHDDEPSQIVTRLDCAARDLGIGTTASLVFVKIAPATADGGPDATASRSLQFTNAGHPPPIVVHPGKPSCSAAYERTTCSVSTRARTGTIQFRDARRRNARPLHRRPHRNPPAQHRRRNRSPASGTDTAPPAQLSTTCSTLSSATWSAPARLTT